MDSVSSRQDTRKAARVRPGATLGATVYQAREWWFQRRSDGRGTSRYGKFPVHITIAAPPRCPDWAFPKQAGCQATIDLQL